MQWANEKHGVGHHLNTATGKKDTDSYKVYLLLGDEFVLGGVVGTLAHDRQPLSKG